MSLEEADNGPAAGGPSLAPPGATRQAGAFVFGPEAAPWLWPLVRERSRVLALLFALGAVAAGAALAPPYITKLIIDDGLIAGDRAALVGWSLALFAVGLASMVLGALNNVLHMRASVGMLADLRALLSRTILERSPAWRARRQTGELMARIDGDASEVQKFAFNAMLTGSSASLKLVGATAMLFVLEWRLALLALTLVPLELAFMAWARPRTEALARVSREERGRFAGRLAEMLNGLSAIQAARAEAPVTDALSRRQASLNRALLRAQVWGEVTRAGPTTLSALVRAAVFLAGGLMVIAGNWQVGSLIAFTGYLGFLIGPTQSLMELWHSQARVRAALDRLSQVMAPEPHLAWPAHPAPLPAGGGAIRLDGVSVAAGDTVLLEGVDAVLPPGAKIRVCGPSGLGKTSLLALLQRHADPVAGRILLDGVDLRCLSRDAIRGAVALVPQRPFVVSGTVADNLALSNPRAGEAAMAEVVAVAGLTERFAAAGGLTARLGEDGLTLSGGERQRLCVARALMRPFRVLVLDEALSEVDPDTVHRIVSAIDARFPATTRLVATHGHEAAHGPFDRVLDLSRWRRA